MLGTSLDTRGGISSVVNVWLENGLFEQENIVYIATHRDGGKLRKAWTALTALLSFVWLMLVRNPRLVHVHLASRASFWRKSIYMGLARFFAVPYVVHLHGGGFKDFYERGSPRTKRYIRRQFDRAAAVFALSGAWQEWALQTTAQRNVHVLPNAVVEYPGRVDGASGRPPCLLMLAKLGAPKGIYDLLDAVSHLVRKHPDLKLMLGGDGEVDKVAERVRQLQLNGNVELLGWIGSERKAAELRDADVFVLPSYFEGLPMSVLEAMSAGLPVVTTPVGGIPEAVADGEHGFLVQPGDVPGLVDRLARLLEDQSLRQRMGRAGRQRVQEQFSVAAILPRLHSLYATLT